MLCPRSLLCFLLAAAHVRRGNARAPLSMEELKAQVLPFLQPDVAARVQSMTFPPSSPPPRQKKIDHFVFLYMENHAADNFFGCMDLPGFDSIKGHSVPKDPSDVSKGMVNITCGEPGYVCNGGPSFDSWMGKFGPPETAKPNSYPYSEQSDRFSGLHGATPGSTAVKMFAPEQIPVKAAVAKNFGVFNRLFTATPTASTPNHLFTQSATSCGMTSNGLYSDCGGKDVMFPQITIWDSLRLNDVSFGIYMNSTCGLDGKPCRGEDPHNPDSGSAIDTPDVAMSGVARHQDRFFSQTVFYEQAANGTLPAVTWLLPTKQACDHPCYDVAKGERLLKDVYEAVRAGPGWEHTLLMVAYDDGGGYYDHVVPPHEGVPADESPCNIARDLPKWNHHCGHEFDFRRLGLRSSAMLISPWVDKGVVFQEPKMGPTNTSQFELTSVPATIKKLFNLTFFLTKRDAWAGTFDELLLGVPRGDAPMHLPEAPPPAKPWDPPPPSASSSRSSASASAPSSSSAEAAGEGEAADEDEEGPLPQHCSSWHGGEEVECRGPGHASLKQRRNVRLFAALANVPEPDVDRMNVSVADWWLAARWREWMASGRGGAEPGSSAAELELV